MKGESNLTSFKDFLEFLKLSPNILAAISIVTGTITLIPDYYAKKIYMYNFRNDYGFIISILFLVSTTILIILLFTYIFKYINNVIINRKIQKGKYKYLINADENKLSLIKEFIKDSTHTLTLPMNDGLIIELQHFGIITMAGSTQLVDIEFDNSVYVKYFLQPWVITFINKYDELKDKYMK